jgi:ubiquinone/menaquinone biosynthesis C-methylase UbiE
LQVGRGLIALLNGADRSGPALEVGCGTGLLSLGLAAESPYPWTILTDPSPAFLKITRDKLATSKVDQARVTYAVMLGEEIDRIPEASLSLIVLRSTLHHILDVDAFIRNSARALKPGGVLTFEEPCLEGYVLMGGMMQFLPAAARARGNPLTPEQEKTVDWFVRTMSFYARRDLDKTKAEDKHLFRVDELMRTGATCGLEVEFKPNRTYEKFAGDEVSEASNFRTFFRDYARYCMSWDESLMRVFDEVMTPYCNFVEEASKGASGPYLHGVFVCKKTS